MEEITTPGSDTIVAPATAPGQAALAVLRLSGPQAIAIADTLWRGKSLAQADSHTAHLGTVLDSRGLQLDQAVAVVYRAPRSFTGQDSVELTVHGSMYVRRELLDTLIKAGARLAEPGEFTRRAFLGGRLDLSQAEAVADIIAAESRAANDIAQSQLQGKFAGRIQQLRQQFIDIASLLELELDFAEEDLEFADRTLLTQLATQARDEIKRLLQSFRTGDAIMRGIPVAIVGAPNAGKSSLLNALLGHDRAIVSDVPGTTRDTIEETLHLGDHLFRFIDTAGLRASTDAVERIGIDRARAAIASARIILYVHDATLPLHPDLIPRVPDATTLLVLNKTDLIPTPTLDSQLSTLDSQLLPTPLSTRTGEGLDQIVRHLVTIAADMTTTYGDVLVANARHAEALSSALTSIGRVLDGLRSTLPADLVAQSLRETISHLGAITGAIPSDLLLSTIFSRFCIGK
ncbi:MAG: tRNA uridine-5-carboxymethylaminomethyl(34) synthesis GTPase MnmE [Lepagella sp.]